MLNKNWIFGLLLPFLIIGSASADEDYHCTIRKISTAETKPNAALKLYEKNYIGQQFSVERKTGVMSGALKNSYATKPQVIDSGSKDNSFKVITTMRVEEGAGSSTNIYALTINEYEDSSTKSFVFLSNDVVFFGYCDHFR